MRTTRSCRAELPLDIWERLAELAEESGVSLGTYARRVLTDHCLPPDPVTVTPEQWSQVVQWVRANPDQWVRYTGPRDTSQPTDRAAVWNWWLEVSGNA